MNKALNETTNSIIEESINLLTTDEAAKKLRISRSTLANFRRKKIGPVYIRTGHRFLYPLEELIKFIKDNKK